MLSFPAHRKHRSLVRFVYPIALLLFGLASAGCSQTREWVATGRSAMVATDHALASKVGADVLKRGGNAIDAAVAVSFALGVTRPFSTGLGGGGFLIARLADGQVFVFDFRERAPLSATPDMYDRAVGRNPQGPPPSQFGYQAVATPGLLAGMFEVHRQLGSRPFGELIDPAIAIAERGFAVDQSYVDATSSGLERFERFPELRRSCEYVYKTHLRGGALRKAGDILRQPQLARTLRWIRRDGPDAFYRGTIAQAMVQTMRERGGWITGRDLAEYRVARRKPIQSTYRGYQIITMPPPSSGGTCLVEALNILETVDLPRTWQRDRGLAQHYVVEAMKHAFADRARWMADTDFSVVPIDLLTSKEYASLLAEAIDPDKTQPTDTYGAIQLPADSGTSHYSIVDPFGNCVVATETINTSFGSLAAVDEWGLILNNEMDDFAAHRQGANFYGLVQSPRNAPQPLKRPLSSMTPTMIFKDNQPVLLVGASGGPRIISSVLNVIVNLLDYGLRAPQAIAAPRVHHQWRPDEIYFDKPVADAVVQSLRHRSHKISKRRKKGVVQAIWVESNRMIGLSDPRKGGAPSGF